MNKNTAAFVYLIEHPGGFYKIGIAKNVDRRLGTIQGSNPYTLSLLAAYPASDAPAEETTFHATFGHRRERGEWFRLRDAQVAYLVAYFEHRTAAQRGGGITFAQFVENGWKIDQAVAPEDNTPASWERSVTLQQ